MLTALKTLIRRPLAEKPARAAEFFLQFQDHDVPAMRALVDDLWTSYRGWPRIAKVTGLTFDNPQNRVLVDLAGGFTTVLRLFQGTHRVVLDQCLDALRAAHPMHWPDCEFRNGDAHALPFADASVDAVFCSNALDHFEDPARVLAEVARVLRPAGVLIVSVDVFETPGARRPGLLHPCAFTERDVWRLLEHWTVLDAFTPSPAGKVGFRQLAQGNRTPNPTKREAVWIARPHR